MYQLNTLAFEKTENVERFSYFVLGLWQEPFSSNCFERGFFKFKFLLKSMEFETDEWFLPVLFCFLVFLKHSLGIFLLILTNQMRKVGYRGTGIF